MILDEHGINILGNYCERSDLKLECSAVYLRESASRFRLILETIYAFRVAPSKKTLHFLWSLILMGWTKFARLH